LSHSVAENKVSSLADEGATVISSVNNVEMKRPNE
jgi:hypothetical protein